MRYQLRFTRGGQRCALLNPADLKDTLRYKELWHLTDPDAAELRGARSEAMMGTWLRRIRGAIGMGVLWAAVWSAAGSVPRWVFGVNTDAPLPIVFGVFGFAAGMIFSAVLALTEGRRSIDEMSLPRFAGWGAIGGFVLSALVAKVGSLGWGDGLALATTLGVASAVSAAGSLAMARRAARQELSDGRGKTAEVELTESEKRKVLGGGN